MEQHQDQLYRSAWMFWVGLSITLVISLGLIGLIIWLVATQNLAQLAVLVGLIASIVAIVSTPLIFYFTVFHQPEKKESLVPHQKDVSFNLLRYRITSAASRKVLDIEEGSLLNGAKIQQWDYLGRANQHWRLIDVGNGLYKIESEASGKVLDVEENSLLNGAKIQQWDYWGGANQHWRLIDVGNDLYKIESEANGKVLDLEDDSLLNGAKIEQWDYWGGANQHWQLVKI